MVSLSPHIKTIIIYFCLIFTWTTLVNDLFTALHLRDFIWVTRLNTSRVCCWPRYFMLLWSGKVPKRKGSSCLYDQIASLPTYTARLDLLRGPKIAYTMLLQRLDLCRGLLRKAKNKTWATPKVRDGSCSMKLIPVMVLEPVLRYSVLTADLP